MFASLIDSNVVCAVYAKVTIPVAASLLGAVVGGVITALVARKSAERVFQNELKKRDIEKRENLEGLYKAIKSELNTLWSRYNEGAAKDLHNLEEGQPLLRYYPLTQNYFTVYRSNAHLIGEIPDDNLRELVIRTYSIAKGLVDSYRYNNHIVGKYEHWQWLAAETKKPLHQARVKSSWRACVEYVEVLKKSHSEAKKALKELNTAIDSKLPE